MAAYEEVVKGMSLQNRGIRQALQQPVLTAQRDYLSDRLEFQNYKLRMEKHFRILCFLFFVVLLGIVVYVLSKKLKQEKEKARKTIDELNEEMQRKEAESHHKIASLLQELEGKHQSDIIINSLREELSRRDENLKQYICESESIRCDLQHVANENLANASQLYREKMQSMSEMVLKFEEKKDSNIIEEIHWWKNKYLVGRKAIAEMERQVNLYNEDVMLHFRKEVAMSEEKDYHWVCYLFAGVSVKAIAWLLGENKGAIYQRRFRLRSEIEASDYLHKELFLELLDK
jgi:cbb3-type cytochrome oxidase subunit 3